MTNRWTTDDIEKVRQLAGTCRTEEIARQIGRSPSSLAVKAHELKISLRVAGRDRPGPASTSPSSANA